MTGRLVPSALTAACVLLVQLLAVTAHAQSLSMRVENGLVTLDADNVPVGQILERWASETRTTLVNVQTIARTPVTLRLVDVPEREALATMLRNMAGYLLTSREQRAGIVGRRLLVVPAASSVRAGAADAPVRSTPGVGGQRQPSTPFAAGVLGAAAPRTATDEAGELPPSQPGVYDGRGVPNVPTVGVTSEDDLSRYKGMMNPQPEAAPESNRPASGVPNNPFGITTGSSRPTPPAQPAERDRR